MAGRVRHCVVPGIISPDPVGHNGISQTAGPGAFAHMGKPSPILYREW